ncbi:MAG TPA: ATP phosphoribosyltransferase [Rhizomicrobium sp.]
MTSRLTLAVPSKGRLQEQVLHYFVDAGLEITQAAGARGYRGTLTGFPEIDVRLQSASEIATSLLSGDVHLGITGEDLIRECPSAGSSIVLLKPLGFGFADVVVAVPQAWIDVSTMADLDDVCAAFYQHHRRRLRVATKFANLTRSFFAHAGIWDYRIVESLGATEGAPSAGIAEAIVDITTTGATLAANGLKTLKDGTILRSQAHLAASPGATWCEAARAMARLLLLRLAARERARRSLVLRARLGARSEAVLDRLEGQLDASILSRPDHGSAHGECAILCPRSALMSAIAILREEGCLGAVTAEDADYVFEPNDPLIATFDAILPNDPI